MSVEWRWEGTDQTAELATFFVLLTSRCPQLEYLDLRVPVSVSHTRSVLAALLVTTILKFKALKHLALGPSIIPNALLSLIGQLPDLREPHPRGETDDVLGTRTSAPVEIFLALQRVHIEGSVVQTTNGFSATHVTRVVIGVD